MALTGTRPWKPAALSSATKSRSTWKFKVSANSWARPLRSVRKNRGAFMKIGHVHLKVRNLDGAIAFYQRYFDMKVTEQVGSAFAFLSAGGMHHELALQEVGSQAG